VVSREAVPRPDFSDAQDRGVRCPRRLDREHRQPCGHDRVHVTPRQREALRLLVSALDQKQIAIRMGIKVETVYKHLGAVHELAGTHNPHGLAVWGRDRSGCCLDLGPGEPRIG
jgi:DNA-binding CsgD family transcriptional regulator